MKYIGSEVRNYAHLVYQELPEGGHRLTKDRFGDTTMSALEAMNSEFRACIESPRLKVLTVNLALQEMLESEGFDVPENIKVGGDKR